MAADLNELLAQYQAKQREAEKSAELARLGVSAGTALAGGALGLVGSIAAPIAAKYIGDVFGLNKRSAAEEAALSRIRDVAEGGRTSAQAALEYQRARVGQQATQAAAMGPARERAARQLVGQEQRIGAESQITGKLAEVKSAEQQRAQETIAGIETRAGEAERQRQRQMISGAVTGGLGALAQAYSGYMGAKQRAADLEAQAAGAGAAVDMLSKQTAAPAAAPAAAPVMPAQGVQSELPVGVAPVGATTLPVTMQPQDQFGLRQVSPYDPLAGFSPSLAMPVVRPRAARGSR